MTAVWRLRALAAVTVAATAAISFTSIQHLAAVNGFGAMSWLFPLTLDAAAAVGLDLWARRARAWREAAGLAMVAVTLSLMANVIDHWLLTGSVLAAVLGAFPPAMLGGLLLVLHRHATPEAAADVGAAAMVPAADPSLAPDRAGDARAEPVAGADTAVPERTAAVSAPAPTTPGSVLHAVPGGRVSKLERGRAWFHAQVAAGREPGEVTAAEVDRAIGTNGYAKKHITAWRDECAGNDPTTDREMTGS